jgi:hypothetical protein
MGEISTVGEQDVFEKGRNNLSEASVDVLNRRCLEVELGTPGDHDILYAFSFPTSPQRILAWLELFASGHHEAFQP